MISAFTQGWERLETQAKQQTITEVLELSINSIETCGLRTMEFGPSRTTLKFEVEFTNYEGKNMYCLDYDELRLKIRNLRQKREGISFGEAKTQK